MITEELKQAVKREAAGIRANMTEDEKYNISNETLDSVSSMNCAYGKITGDCFSDRSKELMDKCAIPYSKSIDERTPIDICSFKELDNPLRLDDSGEVTFSAIEHYIHQPGNKNLNLVNFLAGKTNTLEL